MMWREGPVGKKIHLKTPGLVHVIESKATHRGMGDLVM